MSKKMLHINGITNELEGASLFFKDASSALADSSPPPASIPQNEPVMDLHKFMGDDKSKEQQASIADNKHASMHDSTHTSNGPSGMIDSKPASLHASKHTDHFYDPVETIRKSVKQVGKEILFVRFTKDEKTEIASIVYSFNEIYRGNGRKTSENEVGRIAVNYLINDYRQAGQQSILARVIAALNA